MKVFPPLTVLFSTFNYIYQSAYNTDDSFRGPSIGEVFGAGILVDTQVGRLRGTRHLARGLMPFSYFRGIPYAEPAIKNLRFEPPVPHRGWTGIRPATWFGSFCWQINVVTRKPFGDEDCLHLNVATRRAFTRQNVPKGNLWPVIVFIHGGLFMFGSSAAILPKYFMQENVVFVTFNYRLNSFGFLNTEDGNIQGNMGLKDQVLALQWVQDNIHFFNGDRNRVIILGESAGATCAHLHTMSPMSKDLFSGTISMSGTALEPWALIENPGKQAKQMAEGLNCSRNDGASMVKCLKDLPALDVIKYHSRYIVERAEGKQSLFGPTVEVQLPDKPSFLPDKPINLLLQKKFSNKPWISGVNSGEGIVYLIPILRSENLTKLLNQHWDMVAPAMLGYEDHPNKTIISADVKKFYLDDQPVSLDNVKGAALMMSDRAFFMANHVSVILQSKLAPTYAYYYTYRGLFSMASLLFTKADLAWPRNASMQNKLLAGTVAQWTLANVFQRTPENKLGISHGDEGPILFNMPLVRKPITRFDKDYRFSRKLIRLFTSFAATGVPNTMWAGERVQWQTVLETNPSLSENIPVKRLELDKRFKMVNEPFFERMMMMRMMEMNTNYIKSEALCTEMIALNEIFRLLNDLSIFACNKA